jgi:hypothetical protein
MTVEELRDVLSQAVELGLGDNELRFAYQPNYPLQDRVGGVWFNEESSDEDEASVFYLVSGGQDRNCPYAPSAAFDECVSAL